MIKIGTAKFKSSFIKVLKAGLLDFNKKAYSPEKVKCCEVCINEGILCHAVCKYRSATYKEFLNERFGR